MKTLLSNIKMQIPEGIYIKDPESSTLGKKIIEHSIVLIHELGFEDFTFKKLGQHIGSNESSIYRYFDSKHKLLVYLSSWYWCWMEYQLVLETHTIKNTEDKIKKAIEVLSRPIIQDSNYAHINEVSLSQIVINENSKSYLNKNVDTENKEGFFTSYKRVVQVFAEIISEYNKAYPYPLSLASTIIEGALHQHFIKSHFKTITNCNTKNTPTDFFTNLALNTLSAHGK